MPFPFFLSLSPGFIWFYLVPPPCKLGLCYVTSIMLLTCLSYHRAPCRLLCYVTPIAVLRAQTKPERIVVVVFVLLRERERKKRLLGL